MPYAPQGVKGTDDDDDDKDDDDDDDDLLALLGAHHMLLISSIRVNIQEDLNLQQYHYDTL
jgi:hypothetical protein